MRPVTKTDEELIREAIEETARKTAENVIEKVKSGEGSKISQIIRNANKGMEAPQIDETEKEKLERERDRLAKEREKSERERLEREREEKDNEIQKRKEELEKIKERERLEREKEKEELEKEIHEKEVSCPTCHKGHVHVLKGTSPGKVKCTGDECGTEYALIPDNADYKCTTCGLPHKRPAKELEEKDNCPFCSSQEFVQYDWSKLKSKKRNKSII